MDVNRNRISLLLLLTLSVLTGSADDGERVFSVFNASNGLADNSAQTIICTKTGRIVTSTIGHINFYDGVTFSHIDTGHEDIYRLSNYSGNYHLYFDKLHHLWLKNTHSVTCVDLLTERFVSEIEDVFESIGVTREVSDLFVDGDGALWLMTGDRLICKERGYELPVLATDNLQDLDVYEGQQLLQFYGNGEVVGCDLSSGRLLFRKTAYTGADVERYNASSVLCRYGTSFYQIRNGQKESVLLNFDVDKRQWTEVLRVPYHLNNLVIENDVIYLASEYGYWTYDIASGQLNHIEELTLVGGRKLMTDINTIEFDRQGGMWIGTEKRGLLYSKPYRSPFVPYTWNQPQALEYAAMMDQLTPETTFRGHDVNTVVRDSRGWTWVGTFTGLQLYPSANATPRTFTRHDGLLNEVIHSIVEDNMQNIWIGTSFGITKLEIDKGRVTAVRSYMYHDNVPNESFVNGRAMKLADGTIVMQSLDHVVAFNPASFHTEQIRSLRLFPKLIRVLVNGNSVMAGTQIDGKLIMERAVTRTREINVNYNQNSISLTFSALNYFRPIQTYYRYRIKGVSGEWRVVSYFDGGETVDNQGLLHLILLGLRPGTYQVELQASMEDGDWTTEPYVWIINVDEPWWRTTGVYLSMGLLILGFLVLNFIWFNRNMRLRLRRNNDEADLLKRIKNFVERCDSYGGEVLAPKPENGGDNAEESGMDSEFVEAMLRVVPYVNKNADRRLTMHELATTAGVELPRFYELISANLYKNPRQLAQTLRLQRAAEMLRTTDMSIEDIANECGFVTPNYFIAGFFHHFGATPQDYRNTAPR